MIIGGGMGGLKKEKKNESIKIRVGFSVFFLTATKGELSYNLKWCGDILGTLQERFAYFHNIPCKEWRVTDGEWKQEKYQQWQNEFLSPSSFELHCWLWASLTSTTALSFFCAISTMKYYMYTFVVPKCAIRIMTMTTIFTLPYSPSPTSLHLHFHEHLIHSLWKYEYTMFNFNWSKKLWSGLS